MAWTRDRDSLNAAQGPPGRPARRHAARAMGVTLVIVLSAGLDGCADNERPASDNAVTQELAAESDPPPLGFQTIVVRGIAEGRAHGTAGGVTEQRFIVTETLRGPAMSGDALQVTAEDVAWQPGQGYRIRARHQGIGSLADTELTDRLEDAQATAIEAARRPADRLWVVHEPGWGTGVVRECRVTDDGRFRWRSTRGLDPTTGQRLYNQQTGHLPRSELNAMISAIVDADPGPEAEDAGVVRFMYRDRSGEAHGRRFHYVGDGPCQTLLTRLETLVQRHADPPTNKSSATPSKTDSAAEPPPSPDLPSTNPTKE